MFCSLIVLDLLCMAIQSMTLEQSKLDEVHSSYLPSMCCMSLNVLVIFILFRTYKSSCRIKATDSQSSCAICLPLTWRVIIMTILTVFTELATVQDVRGQRSDSDWRMIQLAIRKKRLFTLCVKNRARFVEPETKDILRWAVLHCTKSDTKDTTKYYYTNKEKKCTHPSCHN